MILFSALVLLLSPAIALAHEDSPSMSLDILIAQYSLKGVLIASCLLLLLVVLAMVIKKLPEQGKVTLFSLIVAVTVLTTLGLASSTVYLNTISWSNGPVHWHADLEVWNCGEKLDFIDPQGRFSNKVGSATFHEHNDQRLHVEGVVVDPHDISLSSFFHLIGGEYEESPSELSGDASSLLVVPTNQGSVTLQDGQSCSDGTIGKLQTFVYRTGSDKTYHQERFASLNDYQMSPYSQVPPGDCIIIEFGEVSETTDKLCQSYEVANQIGKLQGEIPSGH